MKKTSDLIIFGATGDLALRKLLPALYRAHAENNLAEKTRIILTCRTETQVHEYIAKAKQALTQFLSEQEFTETNWLGFSNRLLPILLDISDPEKGWASFSSLLDEQNDRIFYLSIAPSLYAACCARLAEFNLIHQRSRVVLEKPIGYDYESAEQINSAVGQYFQENQIYRIDHYLGKETVQNLMVLRFTNLLFENMWNRQHIDHIQISISETVGLEGRAGFYNDAGALRDMVQNHLLQLLCLIAMEAPNHLDGDSIRTEKIKVLKSLRPITQENIRSDAIRGQYVTGESSAKLVPGYLEELGQPESFCETFVALKAYVDNWRWSGIPFYLRTGKRLKRRCAEIIIQFKEVSHRLYPQKAGFLDANKMVIRLQPEETIQLHLTSKKLDCTQTQLRPAVLDLNLNQGGNAIHSDAYKRLLLDVLADDPSLFIHREEINHAWRWIDPILNGWKNSDYQPELYRAGSWGPESSLVMLAKDGRHWFSE